MFGALLLVLKAKSEAAVVIVIWGTLGTQKETSNVGLIVTLSAGTDYVQGFFTFFMLVDERHFKRRFRWGSGDD